MKNVVRVILGAGLVLVGLAGLVLPILPGWIFLIPGLIILGDYIPPIKRLVVWAKAKADSVRNPSGKPAKPSF
jgi:uncharacterized protein YqgC (DUF456 family)